LLVLRKKIPTEHAPGAQWTPNVPNS
jgi:hypothetical protein